MVNRTRNQILNAFNKLIKNKDIDKISVEMIIREADISKATFYRYFADKYDVMNLNFKLLLDSYSKPGICTGYENLYLALFQYGQKNWKFLQRAFDTTGHNSFCEYIGEYSYHLIDVITTQNRAGNGLTEAEKLQCNVFCIGVAFMYRQWIFDQYHLSSVEAAHALFELMPRSLRDYWWTDTKTSSVH